MTRLGVLYTVRDTRGGNELPLLSVSQTRGVVPRSELSGDGGRAADLTNYKRAARGDVVINRMSAYNGAMGVAGVDGVVSPDYLVLKPTAQGDARFFVYWLKSHRGQHEIAIRLRGIGNAGNGQVRTPRLNEADLRVIDADIPCRTSQTAIAAYLDRETAQIDRLIAKQEQLIATLRERRSATITQMVLVGIDPAAPTTHSPFLGEVRASWATARFGREIEIAGGQVDPRDERWLDLVLVAPNHIESGTGRIIARETAREQGADSGKYVVRAGQILYSKIRPALNKVAIAHEDGLCSADMYALSSSARFDHDYLLYYLLSKPFVAFTTMTSMRVKMPKINREELAEAVLPAPPLADQKEIARAIRAATTRIDALISKAERFIELSKERRAALITAAVTGQLEIPG